MIILLSLLLNSSYAQSQLTPSRDLDAFNRNVYPLLQKYCAECHTEQGPGPAHSVQDVATSYKRIKAYVDFTNLKSSKLVESGAQASMAGPNAEDGSSLKTLLLEGLSKWAQEGERAGGESVQYGLRPKAISKYLPYTSYQIMKFDLEDIDAKFIGATFEVKIQYFSNGAYRIKEPRVTFDSSSGIHALNIQGLHVVLNGTTNELANAYVDVKGTFGEFLDNQGVLSPDCQIILQDFGPPVDRLSFYFDQLEVANTPKK